jgi:hypothetical protein
MVATLNKIDKARKEKKQLVKDTKELILAKSAQTRASGKLSAVAEYEKADEDVKNEMKKLEEKEQRTVRLLLRVDAQIRLTSTPTRRRSTTRFRKRSRDSYTGRPDLLMMTICTG